MSHEIRKSLSGYHRIGRTESTLYYKLNWISVLSRGYLCIRDDTEKYFTP